MKHDNFISSARLIAVLTVVSRILGLLRDAVCLSYFGPVVWHYFVIPFQIPNLFRQLFGEGALSSALIPVYTQQLHLDPPTAQRLVHSIVTMLAMVLTSLTALGIAMVMLCMRWGDFDHKTLFLLALAALMLPYMIMICLIGTLSGLLNVHRNFGTPAAMPCLLNLCIIASVLWLAPHMGNSRWEQITAVALAVLAAGMLQLVILYFPLRKARVSLHLRFNFSEAPVKKVLLLMIPMALGLSVTQFNVLMDSVIALVLSATPESGPTFTFAGFNIAYPIYEGSASYLYCAQRLYQLPLGVFGIALATAIFPSLSSHAAVKDMEKFSATLAQGFRTTLFIALPAMAGLILIRKPLVATLFQRGNFSPADTNAVATTLIFYSLGIVAYFMHHLLARAFFALQDAKTPVKISMRMVAVNFVLNCILVWPLGVGGLALSTAFCASLQAAILLRMLLKRYKLSFQKGLVLSLVKSTTAMVTMILGGWVALRLLAEASSVTQLAAAVSVCGVLYVVTSIFLRNKELSTLLK